jgi:hypothetical protein
LPFVVGFDGDGAGEAKPRVGVGEDTDEVGASFDLFVSVPTGWWTRSSSGGWSEVGEGEDLRGGLAEHGFDLGELATACRR